MSKHTISVVKCELIRIEKDKNYDYVVAVFKISV